MIHMHRFFTLLLASGALAAAVSAQTPLAAVRTETPPILPAAPTDGAPRPTGAPADVGFTPTWETQKGARTYLLGIPAPRGQIVDRSGEPLAQSRVSYNLAITFPTPLNFTEERVRAFFAQQVAHAQSLLGRPITVTADQAVKHYKNRGVVPLVIAQDLRPGELEEVKRDKSGALTTQAVYLRFYPNGPMLAHVIGYAGRAGKMQDKVMENNELLWPNAEGREGLEQTFDDQLSGKVGQYNISFDATGKKVSEQISIPPEPGYNVVTTIDINLQRLCEEALSKGAKRGAMVIVDPNNGDVLALATWPSFNPNSFIPAISSENFKRLNEDPDIPLLDRAFRSAYPPGSTFKVFVGAAALQSHLIRTDDEFSCPRAMEIGNLTFRNWKKTDAGMLNFADALTQSCDTWFYQVGIKIGPHVIVDWAQQFGLGKKTGLPLFGEADGNIPTDEYMLKVHKRKLLNGDTANLSIGQGDVLVTPLQLAQAMAIVGNGGIAYQTRLVQQVQAIDDKIITANDIRVRQQIEFDKNVLANLKKAMVQVVTGRMGTAGKAAVPNVDVAGKSGTAQWGPKNRERTAAWFAGFAPAQQPRYAFAVVYEGDAGFNDVHGGTSAAPLMGKVLRELFKDEKPQKKGKKPKVDEEDDEEMSKADRSGNERDDDEPPVRRPPIQRPTPPPKVPFWKRLFG
jgi:penicillin-binding protein 2